MSRIIKFKKVKGLVTGDKLKKRIFFEMNYAQLRLSDSIEKQHRKIQCKTIEESVLVHDNISKNHLR